MTLSKLWSEFPAPPAYAPTRSCMERTQDRDAAALLGQFVSMPPSTAVFANPVRYNRALECDGQEVNVRIRSFTLRGAVQEESVVSGVVDAYEMIFAGLFGRIGDSDEIKLFRGLLE